MSKIVRVQDGDYKIIVGSTIRPGDITLDTNPAGELGAQGTVTITGDLVVKGNTTVIESETLAVFNNLLILNNGETGDGVVTLGPTSGIQIDRGTRPDIFILWDETLSSRYPISNLDSTGTVKFVDANNLLVPIATNSINTFGGNLALISNGTGVITVTGTADYEERILDYSKLSIAFEIISISRLSNFATIRTNVMHNLSSGDRIDVSCFPDSSFNATFVPVTVIDETTLRYSSTGFNVLEISFVPGIGGTVRPNSIIDGDRIPNMKAVADYSSATLLSFVTKKIQEKDTFVEVNDFDLTGTSEIKFVVDGEQVAVINNGGMTVDSINIFGNTISNSLNDNLRIDSVLSLQNKDTDPTSTSGYVTLYSKSEPGTGGTGIYFVNPTGTDDELISKTKAFLYSLIL